MMGLLLALLPLLMIIVFSFACGYGLREWISRRRRAAAKEKYYQKYPEKRLEG